MQVVAGVTAWEDFGIVVAGSIAATAITAVVVFAWRRYHRPALKIECGDGYDFNKLMGNTDQAVASAAVEDRALVAWAKFIRISETRGKSGARNVVVRMKDVAPPAPHTVALVELKWADSQETNDIRPHGHKYAISELIVFYETHNGVQGWRTTPTVLDHDYELEFTLELLVDGRLYSESRFGMENPWSADRLAELPDEPWPPPPETLEFPRIKPT
jgi:hypothetical protein